MPTTTLTSGAQPGQVADRRPPFGSWNVAERAGVSIGSIYEYFPNKESIYAALMLRWNEERWEVLNAFQDEEAVGLEATVRARIVATLLNPRLNSALNVEVPGHVTGVRG